MFDNFIYYIVALLIYSTYQPSEAPNFDGLETAALFLGLLMLFAWVTARRFAQIEKRILTESFSAIEHRFTAAMTRLPVMAIAVFAVNVYGLNMTSFFIDLPVFSSVPTLQALLFMGLFTFYLCIIWVCSYPTHRQLNPADISRRSFIVSKISISVPVLLPWLMISLSVDIIHLLPFQLPRRFLSSVEGQVIYFLFFLVGVSIMGPAMIQKFWGCRPLEKGSTRTRIENLCLRAGVRYANILYWPIFGGRMITAGVMGLVRKFRYILVTRALLDILDPDEIDAVVAHEIGHVKRRHLLFYLFFFSGFLLLSYAISDLAILFIIHSKPVHHFIDSGRLNHITVISILTSLLMISLFLFYFRFIFGYFMRNFERQADIFVYSLLDNARPLISTLKKIAYSSGQAPDKPNWHHFSIAERIGYLERCELDRGWIRRHDRKIKRSIFAFLAGIILVGAIGCHLNFGEAGKKLNARFLEKVISRELQKTPNNPQLLSVLGDLCLERKDCEGAVIAYSQAIALEPFNARALNNLAWIYATCEDRRFRDPQTAVKLAERAVKISPSPHILDTLAESYYATERCAEAIQVELRALELDPKNSAYYLGQLKKFRKAEGLE